MPYPHPEKRLPGASLKKCKPNAAQPFPPIRRRAGAGRCAAPILPPFTDRKRSPGAPLLFVHKQKKSLYPIGYRLLKYGRGDRI